MQRRDLLTLLIAAGAALIAFVLVMNVLNKPKAVEGQRFVYAAQPIEKGEDVKADMVGMSKPLTGQDAAQYFLQLQDVAGTRALEPITAGTLIARSQVGPAPDERQMALELMPAGMNAMNVPTNSIESLPDLAGVGSYVDVLGRVSVAGGNADLRAVYRAAKIVAIKKKELSSDGYLTLAVTSDGASVISRALSQGKVGLVLRTDEEPVPGVAEDLSEPAAARFESIEIIRGVVKEQSSVIAKSPSTQPSSAGAPKVMET
jgi:Flp pilus assembly protein CpaB